jgi:type VI secretion system protein ImpJ
VHPEELFRLYVAMAGELATFTTSAKRPPALAEYRHERLRESFEPVEFALRKAFADVRERRAMSIPIETRKFGYSVANVVDKSLYGTAVFVFAVRADLPAEELRKRIPAQLKVGPVEKIRELVTRQISGVPVQPMPAAPRQISYHAGSVYFDLDQSNDLWGQMKNSGGIGLFLPDEFPGLALELWAIRN